MSRLLARATELIAVLGSQPGQPWTLHAVAAQAGLPAATCTRLLKELVTLGWADQDGNRGAYRLGPRAYALTLTGPYRAAVVLAAMPAMRALAARWPQAGVVLVGLRPWSRQLLWGCGARASPLQPLLTEDPYTGASGRLLLALLPARERRLWLDHLGLPTAEHWPGVLTRRELLAELAAIRRAGCSEVILARRGLWAGSAPLCEVPGGNVALGAYLPLAAPRAGLLTDLCRTAAGITSSPPEADRRPGPAPGAGGSGGATAAGRGDGERAHPGGCANNPLRRRARADRDRGGPRDDPGAGPAAGPPV